MASRAPDGTAENSQQSGSAEGIPPPLYRMYIPAQFSKAAVSVDNGREGRVFREAFSS